MHYWHIIDLITRQGKILGSYTNRAIKQTTSDCFADREKSSCGHGRTVYSNHMWEYRASPKTKCSSSPAPTYVCSPPQDIFYPLALLLASDPDGTVSQFDVSSGAVQSLPLLLLYLPRRIAATILSWGRRWLARLEFLLVREPSSLLTHPRNFCRFTLVAV